MSRRWWLLPDNQELGWTPYAWLIYLPTFLIHPVAAWRGGEPPHWAIWLATLLALVIFLVSYFRSYWVGGRRLLAIGALQTALAIGFAPINVGSFVFFIYAASIIAQAEDHHALHYVFAIALLTLLTAFLTDAPLFFWMGSVLVLVIGGINYHFASYGRSQRRLRLAEQEVQHMAAVAERERIARDLHDVLGHTLSLIVLKAELASRLTTRDAQRATQEVTDIETVARQALQDVRATLRGIRPSLEDELTRAQVLLETAGVTASVERQPLTVDKAREETLAFLVREAATNVARHAGAKRCTITLAQSNGSAALRVQDDGRGGDIVEGNGMRGMRARVEALGGTMQWSGRNGMSLHVELPIT